MATTHTLTIDGASVDLTGKVIAIAVDGASLGDLSARDVAIAVTTFVPPPPPAMFHLPLPPRDAASTEYKRFIAAIDAALTTPYYGLEGSEHALAFMLTGKPAHAQRAVKLAQSYVETNDVWQNQYLAAGPQFKTVFATLDWCGAYATDAQKVQWVKWAQTHLGKQDGSAGNSDLGIWWAQRWSRDDPGNNYFHSFIEATSYYAIATQDQSWLDWLKSNRFKLTADYYASTPGGGSREGTGYGESHRMLFELAKLWVDYDGTWIVPKQFAADSVLYWIHATCPGFANIAPIGDQARLNGTTDNYHRHLVLSAATLSGDTDASRWYLANGPKFTHAFCYQYELRGQSGAATPPAELTYHSPGAGVIFSRTDWTPTAAFFYTTCGKFDQAHQSQDQGGFGWWAGGAWATVTENRWTQSGIVSSNYPNATAHENIVRFSDSTNPNLPQVHGESVLAIEDGPDDLYLEMDLSGTQNPAKVKSWHRNLLWTKSGQIRVHDTFVVADGVSATWQLQTLGHATIPAPFDQLDWKTVDANEYHDGKRLSMTKLGSGEFIVDIWTV